MGIVVFRAIHYAKTAEAGISVRGAEVLFKWDFFFGIHYSRSSSSFQIHNSIQCKDKYRYYVKCSDYKVLVFSRRCVCLLLFNPVLRSCVLRSVFSEQESDGWIMNLSQSIWPETAWSHMYCLSACLSLSLSMISHHHHHNLQEYHLHSA